MFDVPLNHLGEARCCTAGYNARYYGNADRSDCPHGEDDIEMRHAWLKGWQNADSDCWAIANPA